MCDTHVTDGARAFQQGYGELNELEWAMHDRFARGLIPFGPLTREQQEDEDAYEAYMEAAAAEYEEYMAAGQRSICPRCGERSVKERTVCTYGYPGHPGADYSALYECEKCDYKDLG